MRDFSKKFTKPDEMDMKKIPKPRMEEYERRQRREREKYERQQVHVVDREVSLFSEPRRVDPSEGDDHIAAKLGEFSKVKDFIGQNIVGISSSGHRPQMPPNSSMMPGMMPSSSSASSVGRLPPTQHLPPPSSSSSSSSTSSHHYPPQQQQQQQSRQPYTKQADNKPPYNGRGGYPGQPVKNDLRSSSGMAPPKGPPTMSSSASSSSVVSSSTSSSYNSASMLQPPATSNMPNGRPSSADKLIGAGISSASASGSSSSSSFLAPLGPPATTTHNGRFSQPPIPKIRQKPLPSENDITQILSEITQKFHAPTPLTEIAATPRTTIVENYNLNGPNKHKYSFDPIGSITPLAPLDPFPSMLTPIQPISALPASAPAAAPTIAPIVSLPPSRPKESPVKPIKPIEKPAAAPPLEKLNNSTLEHDLELSESDDERKKHVSSPAEANSSESSQTDSSDSGSEDAEQQPHKQTQQQLQQQQQHQQLLLQQQRASAAALNNINLNKKKVSQMITASGGNTISSLLSGSAGSSAGSAPSSASSSNKTPSPTDSNKWNLSRYFKAATQQTQNDASPSGANANAGVSIMLPGGAQIIPEPTSTATLPAPTAAVLTNVKNEAIADDEGDTVDDDDDEDILPSRSGAANISPAAAHDAFRHPGAFSASRKPELSVTPLSPLMKHTLLDEIKKDPDTLFPHPMTVKASLQQQQQVPLLNSAEFVAIPTAQIKHEGVTSGTPLGSSLIAGGTTSVTAYNKHSPVPTALHQLSGEDKHHQAPLSIRKHAKQYMTMDVLSGLSSDTNSSDVNEPVTLPMPGPGGTLQIPGVPAAITALPRSSPQLQQKPQMQPNALTVTPINHVSPPPKYKNASPAAGLSLGGVAQRPKKPRKKIKQQPQTAGLIESSDEEEGEYNSSSAASKCVSPAVSAGSLKTAQVDPVALTAATTAAAAAKKGRGRPRKPTPSQSGNISSASSTTTTTTTTATAKGPTLTAKKDVVANATATGKKPAVRRKVARQNSGSNATSSTSSTPQVTPTKALQATTAPQKATTTNKQRSQVKSNEYVASSEDSSSSSSSCSKTSSSSSDSEDGSASASSIDESKRQRRLAATGAVTAANATVPPARRIVKQLNKRKTSLDDAPVTAALAAVVTGAAASASSTLGGAKKVRKDTTSSTSCSSDESSSEEYVARSAAVAAAAANELAAAAAATTPHGVAHRLQNQSPLKMASSRSRVSSTSSSSSSGSNSSSSSSSGDDDRSDNEAVARKENKKLRRDKPKSDKNKINTLSRIFNPKEGGAKKQGQVVIIDQSDELLAKEQHQHQQQLLLQQQQKHYSPNAAFKSSSSAAATSSSQQQQQQQDSNTTPSAHTSSTPTHAATLSHSHSLGQTSVAPSLASATTASMCNTTIATAQSPRLTPSNALHMKSSPRHPLVAVQQQQQQYITSKRTPDRSSSSAERKLQQRIKTPTRVHTPSRTPTPTKHLNAAFPALICKIELSRLRRIPPQPPNILASPRGSAAGHLTPAGAGRTPIYDHETILHADLQATQLRLKPPANGSGRHTPNTFTPAENAKSRLEELSSNGRLSSRSPKEPMPPNGYTMRVGAASPASTKLLTGVKHEQIIKYEPDIDTATAAASYCADTKFKSGSSMVKQELLIVKQDYKPTTAATTPTEKQLLADSPLFGAMDMGGAGKPRRKRSSSSSSSPYKEKKRKRDKEERARDKEAAAAAPVTTKDKEKDKLERDREKERDKLQNHRIVAGSGGNVLCSGGAAADVGGVGAGATLNHMQPNTQLQLQQQQQQQLPPTNHDRLVMDGNKQQQQQQQQQALNTTTTTAMSTTGGRVASPATQLQNAASHMPPPATTTPSDKLLAASSPMMLGTAAAASQRSLSSPSPPTQPQPAAAQPQVIYRSYFERDEDALSDDFSKNTKFLQEAVNRKHAADREQNTFNQVTLYLEAVVYFLLSGAAMEQHRSSEDAAWTMYKDTLALIKFISSKFKHLQSSSSSSNGQHETHNKVAILSLRCQSLISLKLYKMKRYFCRTVMNSCSDYFKGKADIINGNTPSSISPSNSLCSQGSGSNTPPGKIVPQDVHTALCQQNQFFNYLTSSHDLWDQADGMVRKGNHTEFFIALDHENGPLTLHSSMYEVFKYVQAGLKKLKDEMSIQ